MVNVVKEDCDVCLLVGMYDFLIKLIELDVFYEVIECWIKIGLKVRVF